MASQPSTSTAFDRLYRALHPSDPTNLDAAWYLNIVGTANIIGAGSGGTSQIDDSSFVPGGSSLTPIGGYVGGRSVASGHTAAPAMNASGMLIVAVGAGGAGGGLAQLQVVGSDNSTFQNVGYPSGGSPSINAVPVNIMGGGAPATVNIAGQPLSVIGSVNPHGIFGSVSMVGSVGVTPLATFTVALDKIPTVNLGLGTVNVGNIPAIVGSVWVANPAAGGGFASVAVYGSPANPVYAVGSVNVVNAVGVFGSVSNQGTVTIVPPTNFTVWLANQNAGSGFASVAVYGSPANPVYNVGSVNVVNAVGIQGSVTGIATVNIASHVDTSNSAVRVNVVAGGAGGGNAQLQVVGTNNSTWQNVGFQSGNFGGYNVVPVIYASGFYATVNVANLAAGNGFASVAVYGSPATPVYVIGSVNMVNGSLNTINFGGSVGALGIGGSMGVTQIGAPWSFVGSVGVTPLATFTVALDKIPTVNLGLGTVNIGNIPAIVGSVQTTPLGVQVVDTRASLTATTWPIAFAGSGYYAITAASLAGGQRSKFYALHVTTENSAVLSLQSPSGTFLTGSIRVPGAAGFNMGPGVMGNPLIIGGSNATLFLHIIGSQNVGGWATGWVEAG